MTELDKGEVCLCTETSDDKDFLLRLYISTREAALIQIGWSQGEIQSLLTQQFEAQYLSYRQLYPQADYQLIKYQGEAVGRLYIQRAEDEYRLIDISLLPAFRNQGLGRYLIQLILDDAAAKCKAVTLHVEHINPAYRLYQCMGFVQLEDCGIHRLMQWCSDSSVR